MRFLPILLAFILLALPANADGNGHVWAAPYHGEIALYWGNTQIGSYRLSDHRYFALVGSEWVEQSLPVALPGGICRCPGGCPCPPDDCHCDPDRCPCRQPKQRAPQDIPSGGVDPKKVEAGRHMVNGQAVSRERLLATVGANKIPQDASRLRLTVIGPPEATGRVLADLKALPECAEYLIQAYAPDHWAVARTGFVTAGNPVSIYLQTPGGKVLHRQADYDGGIQALSEALREAANDYKSADDPDTRKKDPITQIKKWAEQVPQEYWLLGGLGLFFLYQHNRKEKK